MTDFAGTLRALMDERGVSGRSLARMVPCDRSLVCRYRSGKQPPSAKMAARFDAALGAEGALAALAVPARRAVLGGFLAGGALLSLGSEVLDRLALTGRAPPQADAALVESLAAVLAAQRRADDALGSAAMLRPVLAQLGVIDDLVTNASGAVRRPLLDVAQQWAQFSGWLCRETGAQDTARACYARALEWAAELGDRTMIATVLVGRSQMAAEAAEVGSMIGLAQAAQRDTAVAAGQRADAAGLEARGYAMAGDIAAAERKLGETQDLAALADRPQDRRPWSYWLTPAVFRHEAGITCAHLAGTDARLYSRAVSLLQGEPGEAGGTVLWAGAKNLTWTAFAHARGGDVERACSVAMEASAAVRRTGSARHAATLRQLHAGLASRWPDDARVRELASALL